MFKVYHGMSQPKQLMSCVCLESIFLAGQPTYFILLSTWLTPKKDKRNHRLHRQACLVSFRVHDILGRARRGARCSEVGQEARMVTNLHQVGCGFSILSPFANRLTNCGVGSLAPDEPMWVLRPLAEKGFSCCEVFLQINGLYLRWISQVCCISFWVLEKGAVCGEADFRYWFCSWESSFGYTFWPGEFFIRNDKKLSRQ